MGGALNYLLISGLKLHPNSFKKKYSNDRQQASSQPALYPVGNLCIFCSLVVQQGRPTTSLSFFVIDDFSFYTSGLLS